MTDLSQYSDAQLAAIAGVPGGNVDAAILKQESGGNRNAPASIDGAMGPSQIMPATFARFAHPGEDIHNPDDNLAVGQRYRDYLSQRFNGDPGRIATAYFSGEGNVAPPESPTPWLKDRADGNGKMVSSYVSDILGRMNPVSTASAQEAPAAPPDLSSMSDEALMKIAGQQPASAVTTPLGRKPQDSAFGGALSDIAANTAENLKSAATQTGEAISEPMSGKNVPYGMQTADMALRALGKAGNVIGGAGQALFSPVTGALTASVEPLVRPAASALAGLTKSLAPSDPRWNNLNADITQPQAHEVAQGVGNDLGTAVGLGMAANAGRAQARAQQGLPPEPDINASTKQALRDVTAKGFIGLSKGASALKEINAPIKAFAQDQFGGGPPLIKDAPSLTKADDGAPLAVAPKAFENAPSKLRDYTEASGIDLNKTADTLAELQKIDPNATVMDAIIHDEGDLPGSSSNIYGLLKSISQNPGQARTMVAQMVARGKSASSDIGDLVTKSLGAGDYAALKTGLEGDMKAAGAAYDKAYANPVKMVSPAMGDLLARPAGQKALAAAETMAANEGATIRNLDGTLNTRGIDYVKRGLDDMINGQEGSGNFGKTTQAGRAFTSLKNGILNEADNLNPDFKAARAQFADPASQMTALESGRNFFSMDKHEIAKFLKGKSPAEQKQFISGVSEAIQNKLGSVNDKTNPVNKIWNENNRGRFKTLFPDEAAYKQFAAGMDLHQTKMQVNQVMAGSPTAQNINFDTKPVGTGIGNVIRATSDLPMFVGGKLADFADKALAKSASKLDGDSKTIIARILTSKDPQALKAVAARIKK